MAFTDELESQIQSLYINILKKKHSTDRIGKTLTCNSFRVIVEEVKSVINAGLAKGLKVMEISNNIIYNILICKYFIYENY